MTEMLNMMVVLGSIMPGQEIVLAIATALMQGSIVLVVVMGVAVIIARWRHNKREQARKQINDEVTELIMEFLMYAEEASEYEQQELLSDFGQRIRTGYMNSSLARTTVREALMETHRHVRGNIADALRKLHGALLLDTLAMQNLIYGEWHEQVEAINELTAMQVTYALPQIEMLRDHAHQQVRLQTQLAEMRLNDKHPLSFLDEVRTPLHAWQQVALHAELTRLPPEKVPSFRSWLQSPNPGVIIFAIRMIRIFNQLNLMPYVLMKSLHSSKEVRREVWQFVSFFHITEAAELIEHLLPEAEPDMRLPMIDCLGELQTPEAEQLLEDIIEEDRFGLAMQAALALQRGGYNVVARWPHLTAGTDAIALINQKTAAE